MSCVSPEQDRVEIQQLIRPGEHLLWVRVRHFWEVSPTGAIQARTPTPPQRCD